MNLDPYDMQKAHSIIIQTSEIGQSRSLLFDLKAIDPAIEISREFTSELENGNLSEFVEHCLNLFSELYRPDKDDEELASHNYSLTPYN